MDLKKEDENKLLIFEITCLRKILGVSRLDKIRNTTITRKSLELKEYIIERLLTMRMKTESMPYIPLIGTVKGKRQRGRSVKRWLDGIKNDIQKAKPDSCRS